MQGEAVGQFSLGGTKGAVSNHGCRSMTYVLMLTCVKANRVELKFDAVIDSTECTEE